MKTIPLLPYCRKAIKFILLLLNKYVIIMQLGGNTQNSTPGASEPGTINFYKKISYNFTYNIIILYF